MKGIILARRARGAGYGAQSGAFLAPNRDGGPDGQFEAQAHGLGLRVCAAWMRPGAVRLPGRWSPPPWCCRIAMTSGAMVLSGEPCRLNDSKQISEGLREQLFAELCQIADVSIASVSAATIDARNIRKASLEAMRLGVFGLPEPAELCAGRWQGRTAWPALRGHSHHQGRWPLTSPSRQRPSAPRSCATG
jgi:hypothetical protein